MKHKTLQIFLVAICACLIAGASLGLAGAAVEPSPASESGRHYTYAEIVSRMTDPKQLSYSEAGEESEQSSTSA